MDMHHFEDRIKNAFKHHRAEVDTDAIWENIEPQLKKKKKRRGIIWFFAALGLGLGLFFWRANPGEQPGRQGGLLPENVKKSGGVASALNRPATANKEIEVVENQHAGVKDYAPYANQLVSGNDLQPGKTEHTAPTARTPQGCNLPAIVIPDFPVSALLPTLWPDAVAEQDSVPKSRVLPKSEEEKKERKFSIGDPEEGEKLKKDRKKHRKRSAWEHHFTVQGGPAFGLRHLGKGEATTEYRNTRRETENSLEAFTAAMFYSTTTRNGLILKTGLEYRQINEKFHLKYKKEEIEQRNGVLVQLVDSDGNVIDETVGLKPVTKITVYSNKSYNHYRFLNVPIGLGYRKDLNRKHGVEISGGVDMNLFFRAKATMGGGEQDQPVTYQYSEHGNSSYYKVFRHTTGWGIWGSYAYDWQATDRLRWQLSATAQMPFKPVTNTEFTVAQRYFNMGVQAGVVYRLMKGKKGK